MSTAETQPPSDSGEPDRSSSSRAWQIAFAVVAVLLVGAILLLVLRDGDDDDEVSTDTTSSSTTTSTTTSTTEEPTDRGSEDRAPVPAPTEPAPAEAVAEPDCSAGLLLAAAADEIFGEGVSVEVTAFDCTANSYGGYAWAQLTPAPDALLETATVFYGAELGATPGTYGPWQPLGYGTDVFCDDVIDPQTCDALAGAPRG